MKLPHGAARIGLAAGLLGGTAGLVLATGLGPAPTMLQLASSDDGPGDISGPCDEAERADDPRCVGVQVPGTTPTTPTTPTTTSPTTPTTSRPAGSTHSLDAAGAGAVIYAVESGSLRLIVASPAAGWSVEVEQSTGREIEVDFRSGTRRVQVNVELEDGVPRERVRVRDDADGTDVRTEDGVVDDRGGDDNSGPGNGHDADDNSGSGHGGGDDDNSGSGSGHSGGDDGGGDDNSDHGGGDD